MNEEENKVTYFAETDFRNQKTKFGIKAKDRSKHMYVIGKTGMGKSTMLENLAIQDMQNDESIIFIDPHGSSAVKLLEYIPRHRIDDVIYFAPHDTDFPIAFNILESVPKEKRNAVAGGLISALKKIWVDSFSSRMEYLLNYTLLALLDVPGSTLLGVNRLLSDKQYRKYIVDRVDDVLVKNFWNNEFERYSTTYATEAVAPIQNKVGQFIASPMIRNIIGQEVSSVDFRTFMDQKKIVIINISKGIIGPENMRLLGGMLITKIQLAAMSRANLDEAALKRVPNTYLYVDEFQNFANESFAEILSESRKYKLCLTVANQYVDQMTEEVRNAVIGNVGSFLAFRVGSTDAELMEKEFAPNFVAEDMVNLGFTQMYLKLMIDGIGSRPFSANSLPPIPKPENNYTEDVIGFSRKHFSTDRESVENSIKAWTNKDFNLANQKESQKDAQPKKKEQNVKVQVDQKIEKPKIKSDEEKYEEVYGQNSHLIEFLESENKAKKQEDKIETKKVEAKVVERVVVPVQNSFEDVRKKALFNMRKIHKLQDLKPQKTEKVPEKTSEKTQDIKTDRVESTAKSSSVNNGRTKNGNENKKEDLDEIPEDVLRALLDTSDL